MNLRALEYGSLRRLLLRCGILDHSRNDIKHTLETDIDRWLKHPLLRLHGYQEIERIHLYTQQINILEQGILATVKDCPDFHRLMTIPGVGKILAPTIFYEIGDISRFRDVRKFYSYCRLIPGVAESAGVTRRKRGSKQGSPHLKWASSQAATYAVQYYPKIRKCFNKHLRKHRGRERKLIAYNIIAHKLALVAYHVLREGTIYREELLFVK